MEGFLQEMQATDQVQVPPYLVIGDAWVFKRSVGQYADYTGAMVFAGGVCRVSVQATCDGEYFTWLFPGSLTAPLTPQPYLWSVTMTDSGGNRFTIQSGATELVNDISATFPQQTQTMLQQQLSACDATLLQLLSQKAQTVTYAGQTYSLHNIKDLWLVRQGLAVKVAEETKLLSGNRRANLIKPRFVPPWM